MKKIADMSQVSRVEGLVDLAGLCHSWWPLHTGTQRRTKSHRETERQRQNNETQGDTWRHMETHGDLLLPFTRRDTASNKKSDSETHKHTQQRQTMRHLKTQRDREKQTHRHTEIHKRRT
jgi:hypothetical protein